VTGPGSEALAKAWQQYRLAEAGPALAKLDKALDAKDKFLANQLLSELADQVGGAEALGPIREREKALPWPPQVVFDLSPDEKLVLVWIPLGHFQMGSTKGKDNERPVRKVTFTKGFYMGQTEVTEGQWKALIGYFTRGTNFRRKLQGPKQPVEGISSFSMNQWLTKLGDKVGKPGYFRLPSEAEWEYACRAGSTTEYSFGDNAANLGDHAWFQANSKEDSHPVAQKKPNAWGLYDMHGNAREWCNDPYEEKPAANDVVDPPVRPKIIDGLIVVRGGAWGDPPLVCRSSARFALHSGVYAGDPQVGFRVVFQPE
jgi:formylglycine-generating enzyme required for sulfatase activity